MKYRNPTPGVAVLIYNKAGQILLIKRNTGNGIGSWSPPGGFIEHKEHFFDAAKRETLEEVGIKIDNPKLFSVTDEQYENGNHHITIWVKPTSFTGGIKIDPGEVADFFWCDVENLPKELFLPFKHLLETDEWKCESGRECNSDKCTYNTNDKCTKPKNVCSFETRKRKI